MLLSIPKVKSIHCLQLWALTVSQALVSVHLAVGTITWPFGGGAKPFCSIFKWLNSHSPAFSFHTRGWRQRPVGAAGSHWSAQHQIWVLQHHHPSGALLRGHEALLAVPRPQWVMTGHTAGSFFIPGAEPDQGEVRWEPSQRRSTLDTQSCMCWC